MTREEAAAVRVGQVVYHPAEEPNHVTGRQAGFRVTDRYQSPDTGRVWVKLRGLGGQWLPADEYELTEAVARAKRSAAAQPGADA